MGSVGSTGAVGAQGPQGPPGTAGVSVQSFALDAGDPTCPTGGTRFVSATGTTYACHGEVGPRGLPGAMGETGAPGVSVVTTALDAGDPSCPYGGSRIVGANGTTYACSGAPGADGAAGQSVTVTPIGLGDPTCPQGGSLFTAANGATAYACNGQPGPAPFIASSAGLTGDGTAQAPLSVAFSGTGVANTVARSDHAHAEYQLASAPADNATRLGGKLLAQVECQARLGQWDAQASSCIEFVTVGCDACNWTTAVSSCPADRHLCTVGELWGGALTAYMAQRRYGSLSSPPVSYYVWSRGWNPTATPDSTGNQFWYPWPYATNQSSCSATSAPMLSARTQAGSGDYTGAMGCYLKSYAGAFSLCCLNL